MDPPLSAAEQLQHEASALAVDDILALCYALQQRQQPARLRLYMELLRRRGGERAQFASALICFDLARQGDQAAQRDFSVLADTMRALAKKNDLIVQLVEGDLYLTYVWELCLAQLDHMDTRFEEAPATTAPVGNLDLLSDADFAEEIPSLIVDDAEIRQQFEEALEAFLGGVPGVPMFDADAGFRLKNSRDTERIEAFLRELDSLRNYVRIARGYRAMVLLFYGTHMRSRNIFGVVNTRKQELLLAGIAEFGQSGDILAEVAGILTPLHCDPAVWSKVSDIIYDYLAYCAENPDTPVGILENYDAVGRLIQREQGRRRWLR